MYAAAAFTNIIIIIINKFPITMRTASSYRRRHRHRASPRGRRDEPYEYRSAARRARAAAEIYYARAYLGYYALRYGSIRVRRRAGGGGGAAAVAARHR